MSDVVIRAEHLSKYYRLGSINHGMLYKDIQSWLARKMGKEDPHGQIGQDHFADRPEGFWALKDLNFDIKQGDRVGIIGKNGAGKSTLLKILSRITAPTEGQVKIKGRVASLLEVGTGFHGELSGRENIYLNGAILGMKRREITRKLDEIIDFSEISQHIDTPVKRYSSGMYVRLAFAVAAHLDSDILIADEVLAVGDAAFQKKALGKMQDLSTGQGRTVLFVSHNMASVGGLCNEGIILQKGRIAMQAKVEMCVNSYLAINTSSNYSGFWNGSEGDSRLKIHQVFLSPTNEIANVRSSYVRGEVFFLNIEYEIFVENPNYVLSVEVLNKTGTKLLVSSATDYFKKDDLRSISTCGKHVVSLKLDTSIFGSGAYTIRFDFAIHDVKRIITDSPSLAFEVTASNMNMMQIAVGRQDIIYPDWSWTKN